MMSVIGPHMRSTTDVHCDEPIPRKKRFGRGLRAGMVEPRYALDRRPRFRRVPFAEGTRARGLHAVFLTFGLAEQGHLRSLDQVRRISACPSGRRSEQP